MFYTITSRLPFVQSDSSPRKLFKIFLIGSICYIILHYYLYTKTEGAILLKLRQYIYYIMAGDFAIAYLLGKLWKSSNKYNKNNDDNNDIDEKDTIFNQQKALQEYEELKRLQMLKQMQMADSPFVKKDDLGNKSDKKQNKSDNSDSHSKNKPKTDTTSTTSRHSKDSKHSKNESKKKIEKDDIADTTLPIYKKK